MFVPWKHGRCIVCLRQAKLTREHLIPESLGGRLVTKFLCKPCNSTLGSRTESIARSDPSIRLAIGNLSNRLPALARKLSEDQPYIAESTAGQVKGYVKNGQFYVRSTRLEDGSLVQPTPEAQRTVENILRKAGHEAPLRLNALQLFENASENERVEIAPGLEVIKWAIDRIQPDLSTPLMDPLVPIKIAFEFLALHLGGAVYDEAPQTAWVRKVLSDGDVNADFLQVEQLRGPQYAPFHGICFEGNGPRAKVQIRLFGWLAFRVHFLHLAVGGPRFVYTHDLELQKEYVQQLNE